MRKEEGVASRVAADALGLLLGAALTFAAVSLLWPPDEYHVVFTTFPLLLGAAAAVIAWRRSCSWLTVWVLAAGGILLGGTLEYVAYVALFVLSYLLPYLAAGLTPVTSAVLP